MGNTKPVSGLWVLCAVFLLFSANAIAEVDVQLAAHKVVTASEGKESLVEASDARPGDVIEYTATFRNPERKAITQLEPTLPIPAGAVYIPGSAQPERVMASVDGRLYSSVPLKRKIKNNGREVEELVPYSEYRFLRWHAGQLAADGKLKVKARVRVSE